VHPLLVTLWFGARIDPARLCSFIDSHRDANNARLEYYRSVPRHRLATRLTTSLP